MFVKKEKYDDTGEINIVLLQPRMGMGNDCWGMPVGLPQSPECGYWGEPGGITSLHLREAAGGCNCLKRGSVGRRNFRAVLKGNLRFETLCYPISGAVF